jgi:hypothetical protein
VPLDDKHPIYPLSTSALISAEEGYKATSNQISAYQQRIGSLNFAFIVIRPDIVYTVSSLSRFL